MVSSKPFFLLLFLATIVTLSIGAEPEKKDKDKPAEEAHPASPKEKPAETTPDPPKKADSDQSHANHANHAAPEPTFMEHVTKGASYTYKLIFKIFSKTIFFVTGLTATVAKSVYAFTTNYIAEFNGETSSFSIAPERLREHNKQPLPPKK